MHLYLQGEKIGVDISKEDLQDKFEKFGAIVSIWVARQPPGFAFIEYEDRRDGEDAMREMNGRAIQGCDIRVEESRTRGNRDGGGRDQQQSMVKPGDWPCPQVRYGDTLPLLGGGVGA